MALRNILFILQTFCLFFALCIFPLPLSAEEAHSPELKDIIVTTSTTDLLLFATVHDCFTPRMITGVQNGIPITFSFKIELVKIVSGWFNKTLTNMEITHTMTYDSLKQEFTIEQSNHLRNNHTTRSLEDAKQLMAELNGVRLLALEQLRPDAPYQLKIKATLEKTTLPLGMHYIVPFTSLWDFETDWRILDFRY